METPNGTGTPPAGTTPAGSSAVPASTVVQPIVVHVPASPAPTSPAAASNELAEAKAKIEELTRQLAAAQQPATASVNLDTAISQATEALRAQLAGQLSTLQAELAEERRKREAETLSRLRLEVIAEHGGPTALIPELVTGNDEASLRASAAASVARLNNLAQTITQRTNTTPAAPVSPTPPAGAIPQPAVSGGTTGDATVDVSKLSPAEYAALPQKTREALMKKAASRYSVRQPFVGAIA